MFRRIFSAVEWAFLFIFFIQLNHTQAQNFEGKVKFKISYEDMVSNMSYFVKDGKIRVETNDEMQVVLINDGDRMYMLMPSQGMYMEVPNSISDFADDSEENSEMPDISKTGEKKEILGFTTEKWLIPGDDEDVEMWVSEDLGNFTFLGNPMQQEQPEWQSKLGSSGFFPLLVINRDKSGNELGRWEVTEMKKEKVADEMFKIPSNLKKMDMPGMFKD